jgi:formylglycine-generating enzyme required for sulfatase activity
MRRCVETTVALAALVALAAAAEARKPRAERAGMVRIGAGTYHPPFPTAEAEKDVAVATFWLDARPVTNAEFLAFVKAEPRWRRGQVKRLFADEQYLAHWSGPLALGERAPARAPVVRVSWFAARAYCAWRGKRLPSEREWELAAAASATVADASADKAWQAQILRWYEQPVPAVLPSVGRAEPNVFGVYDLHGLVWEWVEDFSATLMGEDDRDEGGDKERFCGGAGARARDPGDYAAFMRFAYRSSLEARYTTAGLGFRCAADEEDQR